MTTEVLLRESAVHNDLQLQAWHRVHAKIYQIYQVFPTYTTILYYSICIYMYIAHARFKRTVYMLWPDHLNLACSGSDKCVHLVLLCM